MVKIKPGKDYLVALESVAMTDIVLTMFIFFFISFSLLYTFSSTRLSKIEIKLPKASSAVALEGAERVTLAINESGDYYINDDRVKYSDLRNALKAKFKENPSLSLLLKVDILTKFDSVARALDVINELNIQKVSLASVKKEGV
jgi:biopolymer transport protein ExbD